MKAKSCVSIKCPLVHFSTFFSTKYFFLVAGRGEGSLVAQLVKNACSARDLGLIPGSVISPGEENGNPLQYP